MVSFFILIFVPMSNFRPQITYITEESTRDYRNNMRSSRTITKRFDTYAQLKRSLKAILISNLDEYAFVSRSRRGEWGEWFEHWALVNGKPKIIKEGWM